MGVYNRKKKVVADHLATLDYRWMLLADTYSPSADHDVVSDLVAHEISASGYARQSEAGEATSQDDANGRAELTHTDVTFPITQIGVALRFAVRYIHDVGGDSSSNLSDWYDLGAHSTDGGDLLIRAGSDGSFHVL